MPKPNLPHEDYEALLDRVKGEILRATGQELREWKATYRGAIRAARIAPHSNVQAHYFRLARHISAGLRRRGGRAA